MKRAKATASAAAARTPGRKLLASLSMGMEASSDRDADYRGGPSAPFSPHLFVGVEEEWHKHEHAHCSDEGNRSDADIGSNAHVATPTASLGTSASTANNSAGSVHTPDTNNEHVRSKSLAVGSVTPAPTTCARRSPPTCTASTGLTRYFTPRQYEDTSPLPERGVRRDYGEPVSSLLRENVALAIEAEAEACEDEDDGSRSVSTVVSARSLGGGSYDAARNKSSAAPQVRDAFGDKDDNDIAIDAGGKGGPDAETENSSVISAREVHGTFPTMSLVGNIVAFTETVVPMSNIKARPPRISEEGEDEENECWNIRIGQGESSEGHGVSPIRGVRESSA